MLKEETSEVRQAAGDSILGQESYRQQTTDAAIEASDFERQVAAQRHESRKASVQCLCVHGRCKEGKAECNGPCDKGWTGHRCDVPTSSNEALAHVNRNSKKDFTRDGLYKPQQIQDERLTGPAKKIEDEELEVSQSKAKTSHNK